jgi:hypothetical protein
VLKSNFELIEASKLKRSAFKFLHDAHSTGSMDIYCTYIMLALFLDSPSRDPNSASQQRGLNLFSIAAMTNIPRETVRRKIKRLVIDGCVRETGNKTYELSDPGIMTSILAPLRRDPA